MDLHRKVVGPPSDIAGITVGHRWNVAGITVGPRQKVVGIPSASPESRWNIIGFAGRSPEYCRLRRKVAGPLPESYQTAATRHRPPNHHFIIYIYEYCSNPGFRIGTMSGREAGGPWIWIQRPPVVAAKPKKFKRGYSNPGLEQSPYIYIITNIKSLIVKFDIEILTILYYYFYIIKIKYPWIFMNLYSYMDKIYVYI